MPYVFLQLCVRHGTVTSTYGFHPDDLNTKEQERLCLTAAGDILHSCRVPIEWHLVFKERMH